VGLRRGRVHRASGPLRLVRDVRVISEAIGDGVKRIYDGEHAAKKKLRRMPGQLAEQADLMAAS
jgi:N-acetylneuraminate synthase